MRKWKPLLVLVISLGLHGCAGIYSVVEFEVLEPATVSFPDQVSQLLILNRAPLSFNVFTEEDRKGMDKNQLLILDTLICNSINRGLLHVLRQSPIERFHVPIWLSERRGDTTLMEDMVLTKREVAAMCDKMDGDAVISLEFYSMDLDEAYDYYTDAPGLVQNHYFQISNSVKWFIYLPGNPRPFDKYAMEDTLFFPEVLNGQVTQTPTTLQMIRESFYESGVKYGMYLVPVWIQTSRSLYKGNEDSLRHASKYTDKGEWTQAYKIWENLSISLDSTLASKALHNMAIYWELEDNLELASLLVDQALEHDTLEVVRLYREELNTRIDNRKEVINQVRF